jgi:hypothetical protein
MRLSSIVFGMVHSNRIAVVLLHKLLVPDLALFVILSALHEFYIHYYKQTYHSGVSPIDLPFPILLITSNFSSVPIVFHKFFTWIALGNADLCFWLIMVINANAVEGGTISATSLYHQCNQSIHVTDGMIVTSHSASLQHKKSVARGLLCQIVLNQKLLYEFKKWCKFSRRVTVKKSCKKIPACM